MTELVRIKAPAFPCGTCGTNDWNWNENSNKWECRHCSLNGRPEPKRPEVDMISSADVWCEEMLTQYDIAFQALEKEKEIKDTEGKAITIMKKARMNRAEKQLAIASIRADAASLVQQLQRGTTKGDVYLVLPEADINVHLQW